MDGADEVIVRTNDRREFVATVVGSDKRSDTAVLKLDATGLPTVKLGSSKNLKVGEWVLAIGSPFGFEHSATAGIVSALGRSLPSENYVPFIQTDVAINPGNSGGPLFNLAGEVVGVNSQIYSRTGGFMGLSFAIPIDVAMDAVEQLKAKGHVSRGWLAVPIQDVTRDLAETFGMKQPVGALVAQVLSDSPAEKAGLEPGDVILKYDGKEVASSGILPQLVGVTRVGQSAQVQVLRKGQPRELTVVIGELPDEDASPISGATRAGDRQPSGVGAARPDPGSARAGRRAQGRCPGGGGQARAGQQVGIRAGDVILMIDNQPVFDRRQFRGMVEGLAPAARWPCWCSVAAGDVLRAADPQDPRAVKRSAEIAPPFGDRAMPPPVRPARSPLDERDAPPHHPDPGSGPQADPEYPADLARIRDRLRPGYVPPGPPTRRRPCASRPTASRRSSPCSAP